MFDFIKKLWDIKTTFFYLIDLFLPDSFLNQGWGGLIMYASGLKSQISTIYITTKLFHSKVYKS